MRGVFDRGSFGTARRDRRAAPRDQRTAQGNPRRSAAGHAARGFALGLGLALAAPGMAVAREKPPLPDPLPCPIDAPVRVASEDTLRHFTALASCAPSSVIVAPAKAQADTRPTVRVAPLEDPGEGIGWSGEHDARSAAPQPLDAGLRQPVRRTAPAGRFEEARIGASQLRVVRIVPPADAVAEPAGDFQPAAYTVPADGPGGFGAPVARAEAAILGAHPRSFASPYDSLIAAAAARHKVDPLMLHAVITQESRYHPAALSAAGARGLMQITPATGASLGVADARHLYDPATNIDAGARLLKQLWDRLDGRFDLVLAAFNAGEGAVRRYGGRVPPYRETQDYVAKVEGYYRWLAMDAGLIAGRN